MARQTMTRTTVTRKPGRTQRVFETISRAADRILPGRGRKMYDKRQKQMRLGEGGQRAFDEAAREQRRRPGLRGR